MAALTTHSVQFTGTSGENVDFDVVALADLSGEMTSSFTFKDIFYQRGFSDEDSSATAIIDVSAADYNDLFKLNVPLYDPANGTPNTDLVRYLTNASGWTDVAFSSAVVSSAADPRGPIFSSHSDQSIKKDFLRSMLRDITGTTRLNNLFKNQSTMVTHIEGLDASFNAEVDDLLSKIEGAGWLTDADYGVLQSDEQTYSFKGIFNPVTTDPSDESDVSAGVAALYASTFSKFNPLRILSSSILGEEDADNTDDYDISGSGLNNSARREVLIASLQTEVEAHWNDISATTFEGIDSDGTKWRVWTTNEGAVAAGVSDAVAVDGSKFSTYLDGYNVYIPPTSGSTADCSGLIDVVVDHEYPFEFQAGDRLHVLITYKPQSGTFDLLSTSSAVSDRTYEVILNMK
jgi:hypothetical protein